VQDFEVDAAFDLGLLPAQGPIHDVALRIEKFFTLAFDRVSGISARMVERARAKGVPANRAVLFPNWVDVDAIYPLDPVPTAPTSSAASFSLVPGIEERSCCSTPATWAQNRGLNCSPIGRTFRGRSAVHFVFCGDGAFRERF
jgi:colanic acid biosynthesis glycosyl transferase WcaI